MTIDQAIRLFKLHLEHSDQLDHRDFDNCVNLGIEALKMVKARRLIGLQEGALRYVGLPGETEE